MNFKPGILIGTIKEDGEIFQGSLSNDLYITSSHSGQRILIGPCNIDILVIDEHSLFVSKPMVCHCNVQIDGPLTIGGEINPAFPDAPIQIGGVTIQNGSISASNVVYTGQVALETASFQSLTGAFGEINIEGITMSNGDVYGNNLFVKTIRGPVHATGDVAVDNLKLNAALEANQGVNVAGFPVLDPSGTRLYALYISPTPGFVNQNVQIIDTFVKPGGVLVTPIINANNITGVNGNDVVRVDGKLSVDTIQGALSTVHVEGITIQDDTLFAVDARIGKLRSFDGIAPIDVDGVTLEINNSPANTAIRVNGNPVVDAGGRIIMGTAIPDLSITTQMMATNSVSTSLIQNGAVTYDKLSPNVLSQINTQIAQQTTGLSNIYSTDGKIGIGTSLPSYPLHVTTPTSPYDVIMAIDQGGAQGTAELKVISGANGSPRASKVSFHNSNALIPQWTIVNDAENTGLNNLRFIYRNAFLDPLLTLDGSGKRIGINKKIPTSTFDLNGDFAIANGDLYMNGMRFLYKDRSLSNVPGASLGEVETDSIKNKTPFRTLDLISPTAITMNTSAMVVQQSRIGIMTTSPGYTLDVIGDINFTGNLYKNGVTYGGATDVGGGNNQVISIDGITSTPTTILVDRGLDVQGPFTQYGSNALSLNHLDTYNIKGRPYAVFSTQYYNTQVLTSLTNAFQPINAVFNVDQDIFALNNTVSQVDYSASASLLPFKYSRGYGDKGYIEFKHASDKVTASAQLANKYTAIQNGIVIVLAIRLKSGNATSQILKATYQVGGNIVLNAKTISVFGTTLTLPNNTFPVDEWSLVCISVSPTKLTIARDGIAITQESVSLTFPVNEYIFTLSEIGGGSLFDLSYLGLTTIPVDNTNFSLVTLSGSFADILIDNTKLDMTCCNLFINDKNLVVANHGKVGINTDYPFYNLDVNGIVNAREFYVKGTLFVNSNGELTDGFVKTEAISNASITSEKLTNHITLSGVTTLDGDLVPLETEISALGNASKLFNQVYTQEVVLNNHAIFSPQSGTLSVANQLNGTLARLSIQEVHLVNPNAIGGKGTLLRVDPATGKLVLYNTIVNNDGRVLSEQGAQEFQITLPNVTAASTAFGIGTTSPQKTLDVVGSAMFTGDVVINGKMMFSNNVIASRGTNIGILDEEPVYPVTLNGSTHVNGAFYTGFVRTFPPVNDVSYTNNTISGQAYGNGLYSATASSTDAGFFPLDTLWDGGNGWQSSDGSFDMMSSSPIGGIATSYRRYGETFDRTITGHTLDIVLPEPIILHAYSLAITSFQNSPAMWALLGSVDDGVSWHSLDESYANVLFRWLSLGPIKFKTSMSMQSSSILRFVFVQTATLAKYVAIKRVEFEQHLPMIYSDSNNMRVSTNASIKRIVFEDDGVNAKIGMRDAFMAMSNSEFYWVSGTQKTMSYEGGEFNIQGIGYKLNGLGLAPFYKAPGGGAYYTGGGNVGIGTNNPLNTLDVTGDIGFTGVVRENGVRMALLSSPSGTDAYYTRGKLGIGTQTPTAALDVQGDVRYTGTLKYQDQVVAPWILANNVATLSGSINFTGNITQNGVPYLATQWNNLSPNEVSYNGSANVSGSVFAAGGLIIGDSTSATSAFTTISANNTVAYSNTMLGSDTSPVDGGTVTINLATKPNAIIQLSSVTPTTPLYINLEDDGIAASWSESRIGTRGKIVLIERASTGRSVYIDGRLYMASAAPMQSTSVPVGKTRAIDTVDYFIIDNAYGYATYTRQIVA